MPVDLPIGLVPTVFPPDLALPGDRVPGVVHSTKPESCTQDAAILSPRCEDVKWRGLAPLRAPLYTLCLAGAVAQLGERCVRNAEVEGSTPFRSTGPENPTMPRHRRVFLRTAFQPPVRPDFSLHGQPAEFLRLGRSCRLIFSSLRLCLQNQLTSEWDCVSAGQHGLGWERRNVTSSGATPEREGGLIEIAEADFWSPPAIHTVILRVSR